MFPILNPPPSSLPIPSLWVDPVHQPQASSIVHRTWTGNSFHTWYFTCFWLRILEYTIKCTKYKQNISVYRKKKKLHDSTYMQIFLIVNMTVLHNLHLVESVDMKNCRYRETASIEVQQLHMGFLLCTGSSPPYFMLFKDQLIFNFLYLPAKSL